MNAVIKALGTAPLPPRPGKVEPIVCQVKLVTPLFIAGADNRPIKRGRQTGRNGEPGTPDTPGVTPNQIAHEGLRPASVKAALRFWWRASQPASLGTDDMHKKEAELFGAVASKSNRHEGQGVTVRTRVSNDWTAALQGNIGENELSYLAYGCADLNGPLRSAINAGAHAEITFLPRVKEHGPELAAALECLLLFGNIGAKSRRGWGALSDGRWKNAADLKVAILKHLKKGDPERAYCSSLEGAETHIKMLKGSTWDLALNELGGFFHQFRKDLGADVIDFRQPPGDPKRYKQEPGKDHHRVANWLKDKEMLDVTRGDSRETLPDRAGFGLPYPMQFRREKPTFSPSGKDLGDRRASPVIFRIHEVTGGYLGLVTIMGGRFLPAGAMVEAKAGRRTLSLEMEARPKVLADFARYLDSNNFTRITP